MPLEISVIGALCGVMLAATLTALAVVDLREMRLPNGLNLLLGSGALFQSFVRGHPALFDAVLGALLCGGILIAVATLFHRIRGFHGLGLGDQKFGVAAGLWIGWERVPLMLVTAAMSALLFVGLRALWQGRLDRQEALPFGPFLCLGVFAAWLIDAVQ